MDAEKNEIGRKSLRGGIVNLGSQGITIIIQFASIIILSRLLTPSAFGTVAMVTVITAFASIFKDMGLSAATIQREDINHDQVSALFWLNVLTGCAVAAFLILFSPIIASFYNRPELVWVTVVLSLNILISCIGTQHSALLARQMKFKKIAYCRLSGVITTFCISVITAHSGLGYWALVAGVVSGTFIQVVMLWIVNPWIPGRARSNAGVKEMMKYGLNLTGFDFVNYFSRNLDNLLIGKIWGADALGLLNYEYEELFH